MFSNKYVQASGFAARGYSKFILTQDITGAVADLMTAATTAGLAAAVKDLHTNLLASLLQAQAKAQASGMEPPPAD